MNQGDIGHSWLVSYSYIYLFFGTDEILAKARQLQKYWMSLQNNFSVQEYADPLSLICSKYERTLRIEGSVCQSENPPVSSVGLRTWLWGGVGGGNRHTERQISQPPSRHITSDVSSEKEEKGSMLQELRWKVGHPVLYNLTCLKDAAIFSCSLDQNLNFS